MNLYCIYNEAQSTTSVVAIFITQVQINVRYLYKNIFVGAAVAKWISSPHKYSRSHGQLKDHRFESYRFQLAFALQLPIDGSEGTIGTLTACSAAPCGE